MVLVLGILVATFAGLVIVGGLTGRVTLKSCCAIADPRRDLRMRAAFLDTEPADEREPLVSDYETREG